MTPEKSGRIPDGLEELPAPESVLDAEAAGEVRGGMNMQFLKPPAPHPAGFETTHEEHPRG